ncbi:MAG: hypothetical protein IKZ86_03910 [Spirochaetaceae bacterium]|nr:hypothetical protein [Spirochaetaceae bacterium]
MIQRIKIILVFAFILLASCAYAVTSATVDSFETDVNIGDELTLRVRVSETTLKKVNFTFAEPPEGARRMELKKYVDSQSAAADVIIEAVFIFDKAGTFELPPVVVKVGKNTYKVEIPFINVSENIKLKTAEAFWEFDADDICCADPVELKLKVRYAATINRLDVPLDERAAISRQTEPVLSFGEGSDFSGGEIAAVYQWVPLESGELTLPLAELEVTGTNDEVQNIFVPAVTVDVKPKRAGSKQPEKASVSGGMFADAFDSSKTEKQTKPKAPKASKARPEELRPFLVELAELRAKEHESFFKRDIKEQRKILESQLDLHDTPDEYPQILLIVWAVLAAVFVLWALVLRLCGKKVRAFFVLLVGLLCFARGAYHARDYLRSPALFTGGEVCTVPDTQSLIAGELMPGTRISVAKKVGSWILIDYNGRKMGWVDESAVIPMNISFILKKAD